MISLEEAIHHTLESGNIRGACKHAIPLALFMEAMLLYRERTNLMQTVADRITGEVIDEATDYKDNNVPTLYNNLGMAWSHLGDKKKAIDYYIKALEIFSEVYGHEHPYTKSVRANMELLKG